MTLILTPLREIPLIRPGDDLADVVLASLQATGIALQDGDILILAQKIVSKAEGRLVNLAEVAPSAKALELAASSEKDPRFCELVLQEANEVLRVRPGTIIVEHKLGFVCANGGIDHSNVAGDASVTGDWVLLLPEDPDRSAALLRKRLETSSGTKLGVMIIDSHGRAWRLGVAGACIGLSGLPGLVDMRGQPDLFGFNLRITMIAVADELAAAASLVMGQTAEGTPVIHARGFPYPLREGSLKELLRPRELDLFR
jgi:coenzyme F420-0:L-glutamate ligase / coenzyme F420-1:gamma-L-glutamate ligase